MTGKFSEDSIEKAYAMALKKVDGGKIFGEQIDLNNPKHVALALYLSGLRDGKDEILRVFDNYWK